MVSSPDEFTPQSRERWGRFRSMWQPTLTQHYAVLCRAMLYEYCASTRSVVAFLEKTAIAYHPNWRKNAKFWRYAIAVFSKNATTLRVEAFSPGVDKRLCRFFESKNLGVCSSAFLHIKLADQLETWHSKTLFRLRGLMPLIILRIGES